MGTLSLFTDKMIDYIQNYTEWNLMILIRKFSKFAVIKINSSPNPVG